MKYYDQTTEKLSVIIESAMTLASTGVKTSCMVLTESAAFGTDIYLPLLEAVDEAVEGTAELQEAKRTVTDRLKSIKDSKAIQKIKAAIDKIVNWVVTKAKSLKAMALGKKALESVETQVENAAESAQQEGDTEKVSKLKQLKAAISAGFNKIKAKFQKKEQEAAMNESADGEFEDSEANMFENPLDDPSDADGEETNDPEVNAMASGGAEEDTEDFQESEVAEKVIQMIESAVSLSDVGAVLNENALLEAAFNDDRFEKYIPVLEATEILIEANSEYNKRMARATEKMKENAPTPKNKVQIAASNLKYEAKRAPGVAAEAIKSFTAKVKEFIDKVIQGIKTTKVYSVITGWAQNLKSMMTSILKKKKDAEVAGDKETASKFKTLHDKVKGLWSTLKTNAKAKFGKNLEADVPAPESV